MARVEDFAQFCQQRGIKNSTVVLHLRNILRFSGYCWMKRHGGKISKKQFYEHITSKKSFHNIHQFINEDLVNLYLKEMKDRGCKNTYLNINIASIRVLGQYLDIEVLKHIKFLKEENYVKATMDDYEIEDFLALPRTKNSNIENWDLWSLFFACMAYTGARPGEIANLKIDNVDFGRGVFVLEDTKTNEPRYIPIPVNLKEKLKERTKVCKDYLFTTNFGNKFNDAQWNYNFHTRIRRLGIRRLNLTPYSLRHSAITRLLEEDVNIFKVQKIVGHHDIKTTLHYTHMTTKDIIDALSKDRMVRRFLDPQALLDGIEEFIDKISLDKDIRFDYSKEKTGDSLSFKLRIK